jgi:hypothetical protein
MHTYDPWGHIHARQKREAIREYKFMAGYFLFLAAIVILLFCN